MQSHLLIPSVFPPLEVITMELRSKPLAFVLSALLCGLGVCTVEAFADETLAASTPSQQTERNDQLDPPNEEQIEHFEKRIRPLLIKYCFECHSSDSEVLQGGLRVDARHALINGGDSGPAIVPGDPESSLLVHSIRYQGDGYDMPPEGKMPDHEVELLVQWVAAGAPFPALEDASTPRSGSIDWDEAAQFWAFLPLTEPTLPTISAPSATLHGPVDQFVVASLSPPLQQSPEADRRVLFRRLHFAMTGLPPSYEDSEHFIADDSPWAYEEAVDRLLASPAFGEHWGRFWLDLARYSDTTESWLGNNSASYLYRDWVVQAFKKDLPYDCFVRLQLAADCAEDASREDLAALGFLGLSPTYFKELLLAPEVIRGLVADELEERVDAVGRTFLGLTVACARCHDHKFDPISKEDYYGLAGVFASIKAEDRPLISDELYAPVAASKAEITKLEADLATLRKKDPLPEAEIRALHERIGQLKSVPYFETPLAKVVVDQSLHVEPAGEDAQAGAKLVYRDEPLDLQVAIRGNPNRLGELVPRRFLTVLSKDSPRSLNTGSGRSYLADALVNEGAPLLARVIVNRIWGAYMGRGLVDTTSNFGAQGSLPTHPELLEYLAQGLIENGWSLKWLHREIVLSATFRQSSDNVADCYAADPENRQLWRMGRKRLTIEAWRDSMLSATHELDRKIGGPSMAADEPKHLRRTIYTTIHRREVARMLLLHDFPDPNLHSPGRMDTTTPLQGLFVLNSPFLAQRSQALANRLLTDNKLDDQQRVRRAYQWLFGRNPDATELEIALQYIAQSQSALQPDLVMNSDYSDETKQTAWQSYAHALLGSNELLFLD